VCVCVFKIIVLYRSKTTTGATLTIDTNQVKSHVYSDVVFVEWNHSQNDILKVALQHRSIFFNVMVSQVITHMCSCFVGRFETKTLLTTRIY